VVTEHPEMHRIKIEFEKGGVFTARLLEDEAPKTCDATLKHLPFAYTFHHSIVSGQAIVTLPPDLTVEPENQRTVGVPSGTLCFLVKDPPRNVLDEIYISYGPYFVSRCSTIDFQQPVNIFGQIESGFDELKKIGNRILMHGAEIVKFSLLGE
jgi:cyclophilin family peptidyl-prolyl cis-trans isomerase